MLFVQSRILLEGFHRPLLVLLLSATETPAAYPIPSRLRRIGRLPLGGGDIIHRGHIFVARLLPEISPRSLASQSQYVSTLKLPSSHIGPLNRQQSHGSL